MVPGKNCFSAVLLIVFITICFAALPKTSLAADNKTYYVSATAGNDNNNGLSLQTPWRSLSRVNGAALQPGDKVLFKRGDEWRGQLVPRSGSAGVPITYGAYGVGNKPILLGSVSRNNPKDWQHESGNIWTTSKPFFRELESKDGFSSSQWTVHTEGGAQAKIMRLEAESRGALKIQFDRGGTETGHIQFSTNGLSIKEGDYFVFAFRARGPKPFTIRNIKLIKQSAPWTTYGQVNTLNFK